MHGINGMSEHVRTARLLGKIIRCHPSLTQTSCFHKRPIYGQVSCTSTAAGHSNAHHRRHQCLLHLFCKLPTRQAACWQHSSMLQQHKLRQNSQHSSITPGATAQSLMTGQVRSDDFTFRVVHTHSQEGPDHQAATCVVIDVCRQLSSCCRKFLHPPKLTHIHSVFRGLSDYRTRHLSTSTIAS
jgi:hypothetical protein